MSQVALDLAKALGVRPSHADADGHADGNNDGNDGNDDGGGECSSDHDFNGLDADGVEARSDDGDYIFADNDAPIDDFVVEDGHGYASDDDDRSVSDVSAILRNDGAYSDEYDDDDDDYEDDDGDAYSDEGLAAPVGEVGDVNDGVAPIDIEAASQGGAAPSDLGKRRRRKRKRKRKRSEMSSNDSPWDPEADLIVPDVLEDDPAGVQAANILPEGTRRKRRRVNYNVTYVIGSLDSDDDDDGPRNNGNGGGDVRGIPQVFAVPDDRLAAGIEGTATIIDAAGLVSPPVASPGGAVSSVLDSGLGDGLGDAESDAESSADGSDYIPSSASDGDESDGSGSN